MKKIVLLISIISSLLLLFGCNKKTEDAKEVDTSNFPKTSLISSFSSVKELRTYKFTSFYKAEINSNKDYVTDGDTSAKFTIASSGMPEVSVFTDSSSRDFSKVCALSVDIFNTDDIKHDINIGFTSRESGYNRKSYSPETFELLPGYNKVIFEIDLATAHNICYINNVEYITFTFEKSCDHQWVAYFDNLRAHYTNKEVKVSSKAYEENEILLFDNKLDRYFISVDTTFSSAVDIPTIVINRDPHYIKSGNGSLKITTPVNSAGGSPGVYITGEPLSRIDFSNYSAIQFSIMLSNDLVGSSNINTGIYDVNGAFVISGEHLRNVNTELENDPNHFDWGKPIPKNVWYTLTLDINLLINNGLDLEKIDRLLFYIPCATSSENVLDIYIDEVKLIR